MHFVGLYFIMTLQYTVQKNIKLANILLLKHYTFCSYFCCYLIISKLICIIVAYSYYVTSSSAPFVIFFAYPLPFCGAPDMMIHHKTTVLGSVYEILAP